MTQGSRKNSRAVDFRRVAAEALHAVESVLRHWLPEGKREGREWVALNPTRSDQRAGSFSVNMNTGAWADFATDDKGGDLVAMVAYIEKLPQREACERLAAFLGIDPARAGSAATERGRAPSRGKGPAGDVYRPILPVPAAALAKRPCAHPKRGAPSSLWEYRSAGGELLFAVCRFDGTGPRGKEYAPLSYGEFRGRSGWQWKAVPAPRPLYGLDRLAASGAPVVLVEGEKAADAAALLFPGAVAVTWPGGAKAIGEADFSHLQGREVWYWPDNDAPGRDSLPKLRAALASAGIASFSLVSVSAFQRYRPEGAALGEGGSWPDKADAADAVAQGWTAGHIAQLQARGELFQVEREARPAAAESDAAARFQVRPGGVFFFDSASGMSRRISARLDIIALSRAWDGRGWGLLVRFKDRDGLEKEWNIPLALFGGDTAADVVRGLLDRGLEIEGSRDAKRKLLEYLQSVETAERVRLVDRLGWHGDAFMLPDRIIGDTAEPLRYYSDAPPLCRIGHAGTLEQWRDTVAAACIDNPLLCFAVSAAFAAPLLDLIGAESIGVHFVGDSSLGKSTLLKVAASVCGSPGEYPRTWRTTDNALESIAAAHSALALILDELGQCDPRIAGETMYMLGNGEGKARATDRGTAREIQHRWRTVILSSGEKTLEQHMGEVNRKPQAGMELRLMAIPACLHASEDERKRLGIYQHLGDYTTGAAFSDHLLRRAALSHGTALPAYLDQLCGADMRKLAAEWLLSYREDFAAQALTTAASGQVKRAADKFALIAGAGELATSFGITGWEPGEADRAVRRCFEAWLEFRGGEGNLEEKKIIDQIRRHFEVFGESRYTRWEADDARIDEHAPRTMERYGFRRTEHDRDPLQGDSTENVFYVFLEAFRADVCKGIDHKRACHLLANLGALKSEKDRFTGKARLPGHGGKPVSCYIIQQSSLARDG